MSSKQGMPPGPPYLPQIALVGGIPTVGVDVPIAAVLLVFFIGSAVGHMTILQLNLRKGHKFILSGVMFGFSMARIVTMIMRIVWANRPTNPKVAIAAQIFTSAGVLLIFVVNIIFAQRMLRAAHPNFGWHKAFSNAIHAIYVLIVLMLVMTITTVVQTFYTLNKNTRRIDRDIQLTAITFLLFVAFLPIPMVLIGLVVPRMTRVEKFGYGRWRTKIIVLMVGANLLVLGAGFRTGTTFEAPRPKTNPAWFHAKWCYYFFNFVLELLVSYLYLAFRIDQRFHVPNGSSGPGDYSGRNQNAGEDSHEETTNGEKNIPNDGASSDEDDRVAGDRFVKDMESQKEQN